MQFNGHSLARLLCAGRRSALLEFLLIFTFLWLLIASYPCCLSVLPFTIVPGKVSLQDQTSPGAIRVSPATALCPGAALLRGPLTSAPTFQELHNPIESLPARADKPGSSKHHLCLR